MTVEEKALRYDEVIKRANSLLSGNQLGNDWIYALLPELKESEDEKIKNILKNIVKCACDNYGIKYQGQEIGEEKLLAWLEKKGEQKPTWSEEDVNMFGSILSTLSMYSNNPDIPAYVREIHKKEYAWFDELYNRTFQQPKQEWSEKDEEMIKYFNELLNYAFKNWTKFEGNAVNATNWLEVLKERMGGKL